MKNVGRTSVDYRPLCASAPFSGLPKFFEVVVRISPRIKGVVDSLYM